MSNTKRRRIGSNAECTRAHNRRVVLDYVRSYQPVGQATIARASNLSIQAVSNIMELPSVAIANRPARTTPRVLRGASGRMSATLGGAALIINESITPRFSAAE